MERSFLGWLLVCGVVATPVASLAAGQFELESCKNPDFGLKYDNLVANEKALGLAFEKMVQLSGSTNISRCEFLVPIVNGAPEKGAPRRLVMSKTWHTLQNVAGLEKKIFHHHGISVEYVVKERTLPTGGVAFSRDVIKFDVCRTPATCDQLGIEP
jgi:hypothetical protein